MQRDELYSRRVSLQKELPRMAGVKDLSAMRGLLTWGCQQGLLFCFYYDYVIIGIFSLGNTFLF